MKNKPLAKIINVISNYTGITVENIKSKSRQKEYVVARQLLFYFGIMGMRPTTIANYVNRNRSSVRRGASKISGYVEVKDQYTCKAVRDISNRLK